jgi:hypothetical protein
MKKISVLVVLYVLFFDPAHAQPTSSYYDYFLPSANRMSCTKKNSWSSTYVIKWNIGAGFYQEIGISHRSNFTSASEFESQSECQGRINAIASNSPILLEYNLSVNQLKPLCLYETVEIAYVEIFKSTRWEAFDCAAH